MIKLKMEGAVMGQTVKGAPYSADEVTESTQVLADGTRIHHENKTAVYRDSEGRLRRESSPDQIMILDPVAGLNYFLNPKTMTARKMPMGKFFAFSSGGAAIAGGGNQNFAYTTTRITKDGTTTATVNGVPVDPETLAAADAHKEKALAELAAAKAGTARLNKEEMMIIDGSPGDPLAAAKAGTARLSKEETMIVDASQGDPLAMAKAKERIAVAINSAGPFQGVLLKSESRRPGVTESLGKQTMEGVSVEGTRTTSTLETGTIGNDRPIKIISERWYSQELQTVVLTKHDDPQTGEVTFRLTNVRRGDPGAYLFQVPAGYSIVEGNK
jgi:hypothetical protein